MEVQGLDEKTYKWRLYGYEPDLERERSSLHLECRALIKDIYPTDVVLEEVYLPGSYGLFVDFYLPLRKLIIEPGGKQHEEYVPHFHGYNNKLKMYEGKNRDKNKARWCEINNIQLLTLLAGEKSEWRRKIENA